MYKHQGITYSCHYEEHIMNDLMQSQRRKKHHERKMQEAMRKGLLRAMHSENAYKHECAIDMANVLRDARLIRNAKGGK